MKAKYEPASNEVIERTRKIISAFPEKFININADDLLFTFKDTDKSKWLGRVKLFREEIQTLTKKKLGLTIWKQHWESSDEAAKSLLIYHELSHIVYDEKKNKYRLCKHDVEDFHEILKTYGLNWENKDQILERLKEKQSA